MIIEVNVSRSQSVAFDELVVPRRSFVFLVASQHALYAHADALNVLHGTPALAAEQVQANYAIRVDVRVHGNRSLGRLNEGNLWGFYESWLDPTARTTCGECEGAYL